MGTEYNKKIALLVFANILWGFIPLPANALFKSFSLFIILFNRFIFTGVILLVVSFFLMRQINQKSHKVPLHFGPKQIGEYLKEKNKDFFNLPQIAYLLIVALIGFNGMIVFYFWGLKTLGAIVTSMGFMIGLFGCAIINWGLGKEGMSSFKALYLITLVIGATILGIVSQMQAQQMNEFGSTLFQNLSWEAFIITLLYGVTYAFFLVTSSTDRLSNREYPIQRVEPHYEMLRAFWKTGIIMIAAGLFLIPEMGLLSLFTLSPDITAESNLFFTQFPHWYEAILNPNMLIFIFVCTIIPFFLYYFLAAVWPKTSSFDLWAGIISIVEPLVNMILGITVLKESFPLSWLIVIIILMGIAIVTRYLSETEAQVNAIIVLKLKHHNDKAAMIHAYRMRGVKRVKFLLGDWDLMLTIQTNSQKAFNKLVNEDLIKMPGLLNYKLLNVIETVLDTTSPESWGIDFLTSEMKERFKPHKKTGTKLKWTRENEVIEDMVHIVSFFKLNHGMMNTVVNALKKIPEVVKILTMTGEYDLMVEIEADQPEEIFDIISLKIEAIQGIADINSHYILAVWEK